MFQTPWQLKFLQKNLKRDFSISKQLCGTLEMLLYVTEALLLAVTDMNHSNTLVNSVSHPTPSPFKFLMPPFKMQVTTTGQHCAL